jgi:hypothetical protein
MPSAQVNVIVQGDRLDPKVLTLLSRLEVRESDSDPTAAALRFGLMQRPNGEFTPIDDDLFTPGVQIGVDVAAPGSLPQRLFEGFVTHIRPHFEPIEANGYVEILGMDAAVVLDAEERIEAWPNKSDSQVAEEVFGRYDLATVVEQTSATHEEDRQLLVQRGSDWSFVSRLARRNGMRAWIEFDADQDQAVAHFAKPPVTDEPQPDLIILQEGRTLNWVDIQWTATGPVRYSGAAIDPLAKQIVRGEGEPAMELLGDEDAAEMVEGGLKEAGAETATALLRDPVPLDGAITAEATGSTDAARFVIELRGELDPALYRGILRPRRTVLIRGIGRRFSGIYYVQAVRTTLQEGALIQTFVAVRNATGQTGREPFGQSAEEVPPQ